MQQTGRMPDPSWPRRAGRSISKLVLGTLLAAVRPALGQLALAAGAAISAGLAGLVPDATARWALIGVTAVLLLALAASVPARRRRARRARLRDGAREAAAMLSSSLTRLVDAGHEAWEEAFEEEVLGLAAMRLAASLQPGGGGRPIGLELGMVAVSDRGTVRAAYGSGAAVGRPLRALGVVESSAADLLTMVAIKAWGTGHVRTAVVAPGPEETLVLYLVSGEPIATEHAGALVALADTLRPALAAIRRGARLEAGHER
jgi:hypothetical protein